ncbi:Pyridoxamine 5'-phosphate oxidase [Frankia sp. EI5c]|uniref:pyridoxamine 5'-phosphate oxidase family protein n=1 Tax=Frankia sp. EI5c TaxID=683316 RepID=UPI0007C316C4|nr:pyridoxamine 5'-phosphate oxidase family protein [Frankia sp. EI5c]OAA29388.1 Pyridoxamine 5'-phosphate oxidase [Frankia sp. EI5c]
MGRTYERIDDRLREFIEAQKLFFVASAPLSADGRINLSPKGRDGSLTVLDELTVAYLDFGGSHAETIAHLRENRRITLMWCAFDGPPKILRIHGEGEPVFRDDPRWPDLLARFPTGQTEAGGLRSIIVVRARTVSDSCGYAVPLMEYQQERDLHTRYFDRKGEDEFAAYCERAVHNRTSIDGLPALPLPLPPLPH